MEAIVELERLKGRLEAQMAALQAEHETISKAIRILERENPDSTPQMILSDTIPVQINAPIRPTPEIGLTERCLKIMGDGWMGPADIRDRLLAEKYHNQDKGKLLSSVYATLKRLKGQSKLESRQNENGRTEFRRLQAVEVAAG